MGSDLMKKILMMLVLAPVMAMAGEPAAVTNACDTSRNPRPEGAFRRSGLQQGPRPIVNGYNWSYSVSRFGATIGTLGNLRGKSAEPAASPTPRRTSRSVEGKGIDGCCAEATGQGVGTARKGESPARGGASRGKKKDSRDPGKAEVSQGCA